MKLKSDNDQLNALREKSVADTEALRKKHHAQTQRIEEITGERNGALQRLETLEGTIRGCFSGDKIGVSRFVRLCSKLVLNQSGCDRPVISGCEDTRAVKRQRSRGEDVTSGRVRPENLDPLLERRLSAISVPVDDVFNLGAFGEAKVNAKCRKSKRNWFNHRWFDHQSTHLRRRYSTPAAVAKDFSTSVSGNVPSENIGTRRIRSFSKRSPRDQRLVS